MPSAVCAIGFKGKYSDLCFLANGDISDFKILSHVTLSPSTSKFKQSKKAFGVQYGPSSLVKLTLKMRF